MEQGRNALLSVNNLQTHFFADEGLVKAVDGASFDIHAGKVGRDVGEAIHLPPNNTYRFAPPRNLGVKVDRGPTLDGLGKYMAGEIEESPEPPAPTAEVLKRTGTEVLVSYLPVGFGVAKARVLFGPAQIASPTSRPTLAACTSKALTISTSLMW